MNAAAAVFGACAVLTVECLAHSPQDPTPRREFRVWTVSCAHVTSDLLRGDRLSLARAIHQSEGRTEESGGFAWDICIDAGDLVGEVWPPSDRVGREVRAQYAALEHHRREQVYNVQGNHDASYFDDGAGSWFRKWVDPFGESPQFSGVDATRRPFPVEGTWERYSFRAGNVVFLMLSDRNDAPVPVGRGSSSQRRIGGFPAGAVTRETFEWWRGRVLDNQDRILVTVHHHPLRDTTTASGRGEGRAYHHGTDAASYLCYVIENDDPAAFEYTADAHVFEDFLAEHHERNGRGAIDVWIAGHTHVKGPTDRTGGKSITETRWGVHFLQVAALTQHHGGTAPLSRVLTFIDGAASLEAEVWLHEPYRSSPVGFHEPSARTLTLRHRFEAPPPIEPMAAFSERAPSPGPSGLEAATASAFHAAKPSQALVREVELAACGDLELVGRFRDDDPERAEAGPVLAPDARFGEVLWFDGASRLRIGKLATGDWTDLTVMAWVRTSDTSPNRPMRIVSKDRISEPGCFHLRVQRLDWEWRVWDRASDRWRRVTWSSPEVARGEWSHVAGVVDSQAETVMLYVNGRRVGQADWSAATLDDSDEADLVVGADSAELRFGETLVGAIARVAIHRRPLTPTEIAAASQVR